MTDDSYFALCIQTHRINLVDKNLFDLQVQFDLDYLTNIYFFTKQDSFVKFTQKMSFVWQKGNDKTFNLNYQESWNKTQKYFSSWDDIFCGCHSGSFFMIFIWIFEKWRIQTLVSITCGQGEADDSSCVRVCEGIQTQGILEWWVMYIWWKTMLSPSTNVLYIDINSFISNWRDRDGKVVQSVNKIYSDWHRFKSQPCQKSRSPFKPRRPRFDPYPLFISYNEATNIRRLYMSRSSDIVLPHLISLYPVCPRWPLTSFSPRWDLNVN